MIKTHSLNNPAYAALVLRVALGTMALAHGLLKIVVFTIPGTVGYFEIIGLPGTLAYATIGLELLTGIALIAGVQSRLAAALLVPVLLGAALFGHGGNGWLFSNQGGGWEYPLFLAVAAGAQIFLGNGALALDRVLARTGSVARETA